jgi:hypothetical protein
MYVCTNTVRHIFLYTYKGRGKGAYFGCFTYIYIYIYQIHMYIHICIKDGERGHILAALVLGECIGIIGSPIVVVLHYLGMHKYVCMYVCMDMYI